MITDTFKDLLALGITATPTPSGGGGMVYGGELDVTPTETESLATFNILSNCTIVADALTHSGSPFGAISSGLTDTDVGTAMRFRVVWPNTATGFFLFGLYSPSTVTAVADIPYSPDTRIRAIGCNVNSNFVFSKDLASQSMGASVTSISIGDVVRLEYRPATETVWFYNETQSNALIATTSYATFEGLPSLFILSTATPAIEFDFAPADIYEIPFSQKVYNIDLPSDAEGKTYLITAATANSFVGGIKLEVDDFASFYLDTTLKPVVSRLYTSAEITAISNAAISSQLEVGGSIYEAIQAAIVP